ncbi:MAG: polysialic acid transporter [Burkholderiales bacterium PBB6]|nr:MAG: polysialic acid transporter [Burkholderiales bacterium PBB6]
MTLFKPSFAHALLLALALSPVVQAQTAAPTATGMPAVPALQLPPGMTASQMPVMPLTSAQVASPVAAPLLSLPLPPDPSLSGKPVVFGSQIFSGRFGAQAFTGFNPEYLVTTGDRVLLRTWGAVTWEAFQTVDPQGNVFIPNVGPVSVLGVRNIELNKHVEDQVKRVFKANVGVYASLDSAQPVKVYVTGFVRAPGLYSGVSSDAVLGFLDKAGGIDPDRGSYLDVLVQRGGKVRASFNLYDFLLKGKLDKLQFQDGDTVVVQPRRYSVTVIGETQNPYVFETTRPTVSAAELLALAVPKPSATHLSIMRNTGVELKSEYHPLANTANLMLQSGDVVTVTADKYATTLLVRVDGAQRGERSLVLPNGARLKDVIAKLNPSPTANMANLQLFRRSVQARQKQTLDIALRNLETAALTARSATNEEAQLRKVEADLMLAFVARAREVQPLGQVVLTGGQAGEILVEDGDVLNIPESKNLVLVSGEVLFPNALVYNTNATLEDYVSLAGGYTQKADTSKQLVMRGDGSVAPPGSVPGPGDEIMILPKIDSKNVEITRGITQIIYQIAVAAKVALGL